MRHSLTEKDLNARSAVCAVCGPVGLSIKAGKAPRCANKVRAERGGREQEQRAEWRRMGLTDEDILRHESTEACLVCGSTRRLVADHCHATLKFRGTLCNSCNRALGYAGDNPSRLEALAAYLRNRP